jgi:hypothetical protein
MAVCHRRYIVSLWQAFWRDILNITFSFIVCMHLLTWLSMCEIKPVVAGVYEIFWEVVGLECGPLSLVSTIEELLERKCSGSGLETWEFGHRDPSRWPHGTLSQQKLALTSPPSGGRSVGIVSTQTQATEFLYVKF